MITEFVQQNIHNAAIQVRGKVINTSVVPNASSRGTVKVGDFPKGNILLLGAVANLQFSKSDDGIADDFTGFFSLGTKPNTDSALANDEVNLVPVTPMSFGFKGISYNNRGVSTQVENGVVHDNTDGNLEVNLNVLLDESTVTGFTKLVVAGEVHVAYVVLGDDDF